MTDDEFLSWLHRQDKPESRALERWKYGDPAGFVKFGKRGEQPMDRMSDREKADTLLVEWYRWSKAWRPKLGAPRISPTCRDYHQDEKHNEESDGYDRLHQKEMETVEACVDALPLALRQSVGTEMKNREAKAQVWRNPANRVYAEALAAVQVQMKKRGLFD